MSKFIKGLLQRQFENKFGDTSEFVVISTVGIGGNDNNEMRGSLKEKGMNVTIVTNSLMRLALKSLEMGTAADLFKTGQCAVIYGGDSVVDVAKEVVDWSKKLKAIELKGAYVDGDVVDGSGVVDLSKMPSRAELQGQIVQLAQTPAANVAGAIVGPASYIAGCIKKIEENAEAA